MRKELQLIEQIENYLLNKMESIEKMTFESEINQSPQLKSNVDFQQQLMAGIRQFGAQNAAKNVGKKYHFKNVMKQLGLGVIIAGVLASGAYFYLKSTDENIDNSVEINQTIIFPENDTLSADANKYLDQEVFKINTKNDTVIETEDGVVVSIPANAFDTESETVDLVLQTAVKPGDVLKAGLSTISNGDELETGGMFYMDAYDNNERVGLVKDLLVDVPSGDKKPGMQLYKGQKLPNGEINWVSPKPVESFLTPVDIQTLDFYPPGYEVTLDNWGLFGKDFRDSLYYSFAFEKNESSICDCLLESGPLERKIWVHERDFLYGDNRAIDKLMTLEEAQILCENGMLWYGLHEVGADPFIGEKLFKGNCASCHFPDRDMTGPALKGARERWIQNSSEENFYGWIKNSNGMIDSGDEYAKKMESYAPSMMTPNAVSNEQIDHIFAYIEYSCGQNQVYALEDDLLGAVDTTISYMDMPDIAASASAVAYISGVNPANIQTIWNPAFNGTNLATKEFEERIPWIHKSCETDVLNVYVEYSYKPLYYADSIAATMTYGEVSDKFKEFAQRREGRTNNTKTDGLKDYYEKKTKANLEAIQKTQTEYWNGQESKDQNHLSEERSSETRSQLNKGDVFQQEFLKNLEKVNKELGISKRVSQRNISSYTVIVSTLGWKNIDRKVSEITANRETRTVSYDGKESTLTYESWSATIINAGDYDKVNVYNIPKAFNSYVKLKSESGKYNYQLNADLKYQTLVLAWTENSIFFFQDKRTKPGDHNINLKPITHDEFKYNVAASLSPIANMESEMNYIEYAQKEQKRVNTNAKKVLLREKVEPVIFPCMRDSHSPVAEHHSDAHGEHH